MELRGILDSRHMGNGAIEKIGNGRICGFLSEKRGFGRKSIGESTD